MLGRYRREPHDTRRVAVSRGDTRRVAVFRDNTRRVGNGPGTPPQRRHAGARMLRMPRMSGVGDTHPGPAFGATTMDYELTLDKVLNRAALVFGEQEIRTRRPDGTLERASYRDLHRRARALAGGLLAAGLQPGDRVATLMWNSRAHLEAYYGVPIAGGVLQTVNLRFRPDEIAFVLRDAGCRFLIVDDILLDLWARARVHHDIARVFVHVFGGTVPVGRGFELLEDLIGGGGRDVPPITSERQAATLCHTGGTTGRPKGVVYSHRALILHALAEMTPAAFDLGSHDVVLPAVPMFHVNAWGIPFSALMAGARLILPGPHIDPESLLFLARSEGVTFMAGVPTVWAGLLRLLDSGGAVDLAPGIEILTGGAAPHRSLIEGFRRHGITMLQGWGMTETAGAIAISRPKPGRPSASPAQRDAYLAKQGLPLPIAEVRVVDADGVALPWDGASVGTIEVRGSSVTASYLNMPGDDRWTADGWLRTRDVGRVDDLGYVEVCEREEDLIKSGGEWIIPRDIEDAILRCADVAACAVVSVTHDLWGERPTAFVVVGPAGHFDEPATRSALGTQFPKYWIPDHFHIVDALPQTSIGKVDRKALRARLTGGGGCSAPLR